MNPYSSLVELLARLGASQNASVLLSHHELNQWPDNAVDAMKIQRLLMNAQPATSAICTGCERDCVMPVQTRIHPSRGTVSFIDCDKCSDISRVLVPVDRLAQWRCTPDAVCGFVATALDLRQSDKRHPANAKILEIGMATGNSRSQMLCLEIGDELMLVAGGNRTPLADVIEYRDGAYSLDAARVRQLIDAATTADNRYTPSNAKREARKVYTQAMYRDWQKEYRTLTKKRPKMSDTWYAQQIAKLSVAKGRSAATIKKNMHA